MNFFNASKSMHFVVRYFAALSLLIVSNSTLAATMSCGAHMISDGKKIGQSKAEIEHKCGKPYSQSFNSWIYLMPNGVVYRLHFNDNGELTSIKKEMAR